MALRDKWHLPLFAPETGSGTGGASWIGSVPDTRPEHRAWDCQAFSKAEVTRMNASPLDPEAQDRQWFKQYETHVEPNARALLLGLARYLAETGGDVARASTFRNFQSKSYLGSLCERTMRNRLRKADEDGLLSAEMGGTESPLGFAGKAERCLYFTSFQKRRLVDACGPVDFPGGFYPTASNRPLLGPSK